MPQFAIVVAVSAGSVPKLRKQGAALVAFRAVECSNLSGNAVVWCVVPTDRIATTMTIGWDATFFAYRSTDANQKDTVLSAVEAEPVTVGQIMRITPGGLDVVSGGPASAATIVNDDPAGNGGQYTCGLAATAPNRPAAPYCAFTLYAATGGLYLTPTDRTALVFTTEPFAAGMIATWAYDAMLLVDTTASAPQRSVAFDIEGGWSWGGGTWARIRTPPCRLAPVLIVPRATPPLFAVEAAPGQRARTRRSTSRPTP